MVDSRAWDKGLRLAQGCSQSSASPLQFGGTAPCWQGGGWEDLMRSGHPLQTLQGLGRALRIKSPAPPMGRSPCPPCPTPPLPLHMKPPQHCPSLFPLPGTPSPRCLPTCPVLHSLLSSAPSVFPDPQDGIPPPPGPHISLPHPCLLCVAFTASITTGLMLYTDFFVYRLFPL